MFSFEEAEWNLGGRIKSVLVLALAVALLAQYGRAEGLLQSVSSGGVEVGNEQVLSGNPIDDYYAGIAGQALLNSEPAQRALALLYQESWEKEFMHACEALAAQAEGAHGAAEPYAGSCREALAEYAEAAGWLEVLAGRREMTERAYAEAGIYREETLRIYRLLGMGDAEGDWKGSFLFDAGTAEGELRECGLLPSGNQ